MINHGGGFKTLNKRRLLRFGGSGGTPTPTPTFANMPKMNAAMAAGTPAVLGMVGDSLTLGYNPLLPVSAVTDCFNNNPAKALANYLTGLGFNTTYDCFGFGDRGVVTSAAEVAGMYGANMSVSGGWSLFGFFSPWGARAMGDNASGGIVSCTPRIACDKVQIFYRQFSGFGTLSLDRGGAAQTVSTAAGADGFGSTTFTFPSGTQPVNIQTTGGFCLILGMRMWNSATSRLVIIDPLGNGGWKTSDWQESSTPSSPFNALPFLGLTAFGMELGVNDHIAAVATATYQTNMTALVTQIKTGTAPVIGGAPDVFLKIPNPGVSGNSADIDATYITAIGAVATAKSLRTSLDLYTPFSPQATYAVAYYSDNVVHLNVAGYTRAAQIEGAYL